MHRFKWISIGTNNFLSVNVKMGMSKWFKTGGGGGVSDHRVIRMWVQILTGIMVLGDLDT